MRERPLVRRDPRDRLAGSDPRHPGIALLVVALWGAAAGAAPPIRFDDHVLIGPGAVPSARPDLRTGEADLECDERLPFLLQFHAIPPDRLRAELEAQGIHFQVYVPEQAYLVLARPSAVEAASRRPEVRWAGPFLRAYKLSPRLRDLLADPPPSLDVHVLALDPGPGAGPHAGGPAPDAAGPGPDGPAGPDAYALAAAGLREITRARAGPFWKLRGRIDPARIPDLARVPAVLRIEPVPRYRPCGERGALTLAGVAAGPSSCPAAAGYRAWLARKGVSGEGVTVELLDDGLEQGDASNRPGTAHPDLLGRIAGIENATPDATGASIGGHGSLNAGIIAGSAAAGGTDPDGFLLGLGVAPAARIYAAKIFTDDGRMDLGAHSFTELVAHGSRAGADICSNSWGTDVFGAYDADAAEFDALARDADPDRPGAQPMTFVFAAGNTGLSQPGHPEKTVTSAATAKNVIAVGALEGCDAAGIDGCGYPPFRADSARDLAPFSARGPARDGRLVPTVVAPGIHIAGPASTAPDYTGVLVCDPSWPPGSRAYARGSGTSQSCPLVAGAAALLHEAYGRALGRAPSPALIRALLAVGARDCAGGEDGFGGTLGHAPDPHQGWGAVRLEEILPDAGAEPQVLCRDQRMILRDPGEVFAVRITVLDPAQSLRVALAWTDPPALPGARPALVNDLDLEIEGEGGERFRGNAIVEGASIPDGEPDRLDNLECVRIPAPAGSYEIRVRAHRLAGDGVPGDEDPTDQDFALAVLNGTDRTGRGAVAMDRPVYACADTARATVSDMDLRGAGSVRVEVSGGGAPDAAILLAETPAGSGIFAGEIALGSAPDARPVAHGDRITIRYADADDGSGSPAVAEAEADIDCEAPAIEGVEVGWIGEEAAEIRWRTDEPADSEVLRCPGGATLAAEGTHVRAHRLLAGGLGPGEEVRFAVASADAAGNRRIEDLGGSCFRAWTRGSVPVFSDGFDPLPAEGWSHEAAAGPDDWLLIAWEHAASPPKVWFCPGGPEPRDTSLVTPPLDISPGQILTFRHSHALQGGLDGAVVEISTDGGRTWEDLGGAIVEGDYDGAIDPRAETPLAGRRAWTGGERGPMERVRIEVGFWAGPGRRIRFRLACGATGASWGWAIDDVALESLVGRRGEVTLPRPEIPCEGTVPAAVTDLDRAGADEVSVDAAGRGPAIEIRLREDPPGSGIFAGEIPLGPGGVEIEPGGELRVGYRDPDDGTGSPRRVEARAIADCAPPRIEDVEILEDAGGTVHVRWRTDEHATAVVAYGGSCGALAARAGAPDRSTVHDVAIPGLEPGVTHRFAIVSADGAGNEARADAGGACFERLVLPRAPRFLEDVEGVSAAGWTHGSRIGRDVWRIDETDRARSPTRAWFAPDEEETTDAWLATPPLSIGPGDRLVFWHTFALESGYDGGVLEISADGGSSWEDLGPVILEGGYTGILRAGPLAGRPAWTGGEAGPMHRVLADLSPHAGRGRRIRFRLSCDEEAGETGWWIDDVAIESPLERRGTVRLDRPAYRCGDTVRIEVLDLDLRDRDAADVDLETERGAAGRATLDAAGIPGVFRGTLGLGAGGVDVRDGGWLRVLYRDEDGGSGEPGTAAATVPIDCRAPRIAGVAIEPAGAWRAAVSWTTDEPARGEVGIGPRCGAFDRTITGSGPAASQRLVVAGLAPGGRFVARIAAEDEAGNRAEVPCRRFAMPVLDRVWIADQEEGPGGWTPAVAGEGGWSIATFSGARSPRHAWFAEDGNYSQDASLVSPPLDVAPGDSLSFWHAYALEMGYDGAVVEISTDGGRSWEDAGPSIATGGYGAAVAGTGPLAGRTAWSGGELAPMERVWIDLTPFAGAGRRVRFRIGCDDAVPAEGWYIDDIAYWRLGGEAPPPPRHVTCRALGEDVLIRWENGGPYTAIRIYRDGEPIAEIDGARISHVDRGAAAGDPYWEVAGLWWAAELRGPGCCLGCTPFRRGDANGSGRLEIGDPIGILNYLFLGAPLACLDAADVDDGGRLDLGDAVALLNHLFAGGGDPAPPDDCGADPTRNDALDCDSGPCPGP